MFQKIKSIFFDVIHDFWTCIYHAHDLLIDSSTKSVVIFFFSVLAVLLYTAFNSGSQIEFYISFLRIILLGIATYFIYCLSNYFWFLIRINNYYKIIINRKKDIDYLLEILRKDKFYFEKPNFEEIISYTAKNVSTDYKYHAKRYAIESFLIIYLLTFVDYNFSFLNLLLFGGMFFYVFFYEKQATGQAIDSLRMLVYCTDQFNKEHPKKCKKFIMESKLKEIKELRKIYQVVSSAK